MSDGRADSSTGRAKRIAVVVIVVAVAGVACDLSRRPLIRSRPAPKTDETVRQFALPLVSTSPFLNTAAGIQYVGQETCQECHPQEYASYRQTYHSRAFADVQPDDAPPDGRFLHRLSGRWYESVRRGEQLWHREWLSGVDGQDASLEDRPMRYVIGSGNHMRTYLAESEGFLFESPITWYTAQNRWQISPGYDAPRHPGFERPVLAECLICHTGRVEAIDDSPQRLRIHEMSIGCERCHGPGSLHVSHWKSQASPPADRSEAGDDTIVNPTRLSRDLELDVCAQCHLHSAAVVEVRGRAIDDFRPGLPLHEIRVDYRFEQIQESMTEVGHMEQLWRSKCYQASERLTCTSCHDPHAKPASNGQFAYYRQKCLACHESAACREDSGKREGLRPADDCVQCHMPKSKIAETPHVAFTHHRIGIHSPSAVAAPQRPSPALVPLSDDGHLSELDRSRCQGLAEFSVWRDAAPAPGSSEFQGG